MKQKKSINQWTLFDYAWLIIANGIILALSLYWGDGIIPIISALTGVTCVIFISKRMIANYYVGIINVSLYAYIAFSNKIYGDFMLNAFYYLPMQFIGIYTWKKAINKNNDSTIKTKKLDGEQRIKLACLTGFCILMYAGFLNIIGDTLPFLDSTSTILAIIAMILMIKQYLEQWYLWVLVNSASIMMWAISLAHGNGSYATLLMWIVYLLNSLFGLYNWRRNYYRKDI